jgi:hypothetical protein
MDLERRKQAFVNLGNWIKYMSEEDINEWASAAKAFNNWFTRDNVKTALQGITELLEKNSVDQWLNGYKMKEGASPKKVGVVMAGNIPMVGFHDLLVVLMSGNILYAKLSSQDEPLMKKLGEVLLEVEPGFKPFLHFAERLNNMDAVIATGSDNTAKYFNYYFANIPHIIRQNRTSVGVLTGEEDQEELALLGKDIIQYFGLGCRNISKIYVPENYSFDKFFQSIEYLKTVVDHHKFLNNYEYNKSILLINKVPHFDNGFLLLQESKSLFSPISVLHYEIYKDKKAVKEELDLMKEKIQVIASSKEWLPGSIQFGLTQKPQVWDYADGVDTMKFLLGI